MDEIDRLGYGDNTLILYIWGDNGASAEGQDGTISELLAQNGIPSTPEQHIKALNTLGGLDVLGSSKTDNMYHAGWAWAGGAPYKGTKLLASHFGGTRDPMAVRWPARIKPDPTPRAQFHHVNDIAPTLYEILGITPPRVVNGVPQDPIDGISFAYTFNDAKAKGRKRTQYFEVMGSRSIYHEGWMASAFGPRTPWLPGLPKGIREWTPDKDKWELYNLDDDWSQAHDLADKMPQKLAEMKDLFLIELAKNNGFPIGGGLWIPVLHPELRKSAALHGMDVPRRDHADAGSDRAGARQQAERRHAGRRDSRQCQRRALRARRLFRRLELVRERRRSFLRVQSVRTAADAHPRHRQACRGQSENRSRDFAISS